MSRGPGPELAAKTIRHEAASRAQAIIEARRKDLAFLDALGARTNLDPTTAGGPIDPDHVPGAMPA